MEDQNTNDEKYNREEFRHWFNKLMFVDYPCFFRDILRAQEDNLWKEYKRQADKYASIKKKQ